MPELHFCDTCELCRPALLNAHTHQPLPDDSPEMQAILPLWWSVSREVRRAFIFVTYHNSRDPDDLRLAGEFIQKIEQALTRH